MSNQTKFDLFNRLMSNEHFSLTEAKFTRPFSYNTSLVREFEGTDGCYNLCTFLNTNISYVQHEIAPYNTMISSNCTNVTTRVLQAKNQFDYESL